MYGIFVNEDGGVHYADAIVSGLKPVETRTLNMLKPLVGKRVAIVRTRRGKRPTVVGYADITHSTFETAEILDGMRCLTLIPVGSQYDAINKGKWCYWLNRPTKCNPYPLPTEAVRHGRSWCEF